MGSLIKMKIALVTDTHFGVYKSSPEFLESQLRFFRNQFIPYLKENDIFSIIHLGDFFDNRTTINVNVMNQVEELLKEDLKDFHMYMLVGNHDSYFKTTINVNSLKSFKNLPNIRVIDDIEKIHIAGADILMVPWQVNNEEFKKRVMDKNIHTDVCVGHFETIGFNFNKGMLCKNGLDSRVLFDNYKLIFSGHFHKRTFQERNGSRIQYIGNAYHLTRIDKKENRGFCILDTETLDYEFINNTESIQFTDLQYPEKITKEIVEGNIVDVTVKVDDEFKKNRFEKYMEKVNSFNPAFEPTVKLDIEKTNENKKEYKTTNVLQLIEEYVGDTDITEKEEVINNLKDLYEQIKNEH